jgi:GT2 family glycosyltransferase
MIQTAVVILNYNGEKFLSQFLPSVIHYSDHAEIYVADNGSSDGSIQLLRRDFPTVRVIELSGNFGYCGGYNRALKQINAQYYVLLNSDIEVTERWLTPLINLLESDHMIAAVQPKILSYHNREKFEYAGAGGGFIDVLGYPFCRGRLFDHVEVDSGQYNDTAPVFWASGACLVVRASVYHTFGGLDEDFFAHMEEIDLCWKIHRTKYKVFYCGASRVYHVGAGTLGYENPRKTYLNFRNGLVLLFKHLGTGELIYKIPLRLMLDWLAALTFVFQGKSRNAVSVLKAHGDFLSNLKRYRSKRRNVQTDYPWYSRKNIYKRLILIDYYLLGRKVLKVNNPK